MVFWASIVISLPSQVGDDGHHRHASCVGFNVSQNDHSSGFSELLDFPSWGGRFGLHWGFQELSSPCSLYFWVLRGGVWAFRVLRFGNRRCFNRKHTSARCASPKSNSLESACEAPSAKVLPGRTHRICAAGLVIGKILPRMLIFEKTVNHKRYRQVP